MKKGRAHKPHVSMTLSITLKWFIDKRKREYIHIQNENDGRKASVSAVSFYLCIISFVKKKKESDTAEHACRIHALNIHIRRRKADIAMQLSSWRHHSSEEEKKDTAYTRLSNASVIWSVPKSVFLIVFIFFFFCFVFVHFIRLICFFFALPWKTRFLFKQWALTWFFLKFAFSSAQYINSCELFPFQLLWICWALLVLQMFFLFS